MCFFLSNSTIRKRGAYNTSYNNQLSLEETNASSIAKLEKDFE